MGKRDEAQLPEGDRQKLVAFKASLPWDDLVSLKQEAIARKLTIGDVIREALRARMIFNDRSKGKTP